MKKTICILLIIAFCIPFVQTDTFAVNDAFFVDGIDTWRGADCLVIYTRGGERTGTNEWGFEAAVNADGRIISSGGNDTLVPVGGFVISGHGSAAKKIQQFCRVGRTARYDPSSMVLTVGDDAADPFYSFEYKADGVDSTRGADQMIIYTPNRGTTTKTNQWGYEITVDADGCVIAVGGNNSSIPDGGFVVSAHGDAAELLSRIYVGMSAEYSGTTVRFLYDESSMLNSDVIKLQDAAKSVGKAAASGIMCDFSQAYTTLDQLERMLSTATEEYGRTHDVESYIAFSKKFGEALDEFHASVTESRPTEYRAVWIAYQYTDRAAIAGHVRSLYDCGVNAVCIQTQYSGYMIYPTESGSLFKQNPAFNGVDVLKIYIEECHALGMEIHVWVPVFFVEKHSASPTGLRSDWLLKNNNGGYVDGNGMYFLDPCNSEVRNFLIKTYKHLVTAYDIDGLQLDYIRFPSRSGTDFGYNEATVNEFYKRYGVIPKYDTGASYWEDWCRFRCGYVTEFVRDVRKMLDEYAPDVMLTADVFPDFSTAWKTEYQDYGTWMKEGLLDAVFPMTYGKYSVTQCIPDIIENSCGTPVIAGIGIYENTVSPYDHLRQVQEARELGCIGTCSFSDIQFLKKEAGDILTKTVWRTRAGLPFGDRTQALHSLLLQAADRIKAYMPLTGNAYAENADLLEALAEKLKIEGEASADTIISEAERALSAVTSHAGLKKGLQRDKNYIKSVNSLNPSTTESHRCLFDMYSRTLFIPDGTEVKELLNNYTYVEFDGSVVHFGVSAENASTAKVFRCGDANTDGKLNTLDFLTVKRACMGIISDEGVLHYGGDADMDGVLGASDLDIIKEQALAAPPEIIGE